MKARTVSKKMPFSGQKLEERCMTILQWKMGGLSSPKMTEVKKTVSEGNIDVLIMNGYTIYALHKS